MHLTLPNHSYEQSYRDYISELGGEERYPFPLDFDHTDFTALLIKLENFRQGKNVPEGFVTSTTLWLVDEGEIIGVANLRHYLNERIKYAGGHIGLGIRPTRRGEGLGSLLLKLSLQKIAELGVSEAHIHCHKHNESSVRMILANGGNLDSEVELDGEVVQRYIIG